MSQEASQAGTPNTQSCTACTHAGYAGTCSRFTRILWAYTLLCAVAIPGLGYVSGGWLDACIYAIYAAIVVCGVYRFEKLRQWNATGTQ